MPPPVNHHRPRAELATLPDPDFHGVPPVIYLHLAALTTRLGEVERGCGRLEKSVETLQATVSRATYSLIALLVTAVGTLAFELFSALR